MQSSEFARNAEARVLLCVSSLGSLLFLVTSFDGTYAEFNHTKDVLEPRPQLSVKMSCRQGQDSGMRPQLSKELGHRKRD